jgi:hypothetical protein
MNVKSKSSKSTKQQTIRKALGSMAPTNENTLKKGKSKISKSPKQQTIRNALGSMAPSNENTLMKRSSAKRSSSKSLQMSSKSDVRPLSRDLPSTLYGFKQSSGTPDRGGQRNWAEEAIEGLEVPDADVLADVCCY